MGFLKSALELDLTLAQEEYEVKIDSDAGVLVSNFGFLLGKVFMVQFPSGFGYQILSPEGKQVNIPAEKGAEGVMQWLRFRMFGPEVA
jgi:hypothetical protein